jgi:aminopeptidase N
VLQNIRGVVSTPVFWNGLRAYYERYRNGNATTDDFRRVMEEACRNVDGCPAAGKDLTWLFSELLNRGGALQVQGTWSYDAAAKQVQLTLDQMQTSGLYRMPIEVRVGRTIHTIVLTDAHQVFSLPSETEPSGVDLDPDAWVMMRATFAKK